MKSARELAMERTAKLAQEARKEREKLTPEQRERIREVEKECEAKLAEKEVMLQQEISALSGGLPLSVAEQTAAGEEIQALREEGARERGRLLEERDARIAAIRKGGG
ncbi:MAG: hypothetical protein ACE5JJ_01275 [Nitrospinota bacterium]